MSNDVLYKMSAEIGGAVIRYPMAMSAEDLEDFAELLRIVTRHVERRIERTKRREAPDYTGPEFRAISVR